MWPIFKQKEKFYIKMTNFISIVTILRIFTMIKNMIFLSNFIITLIRYCLNLLLLSKSQFCYTPHIFCFDANNAWNKRLKVYFLDMVNSKPLSRNKIILLIN